MHTLIIKDLAVTAGLDQRAMAAVTGGTSKPSMPVYYSGPLVGIEKNSYAFNADQALAQCQDTMVNNGNNVAFSCGITSTVTPSQNGKNAINVGY